MTYSENGFFYLLVKTHSLTLAFSDMSKVCVVANGVMRFSVCGSIWMPHTFYLEEIIMASERKPPHTITIGSKDSDEELIGKIFRYQQEKGIRYTADAVRELCEDALAIKKALK